MINKNRRLERQLKKTKQQTESPESDSGEKNVEDDQCAVQFLLSSMSPLSKKKTLKRAATTLAFTPVMKKLRNTYNIQLRTERLFTEDQQYLSPLGEKIAAFMLLDDNSFSCPDKDKEGVRYRRDTLEVLHEKFMCEEMVECHYSTFTQNIFPKTSESQSQETGAPVCARLVSIQS